MTTFVARQDSYDKMYKNIYKQFLLSMARRFAKFFEVIKSSSISFFRAYNVADY